MGACWCVKFNVVELTGGVELAVPVEKAVAGRSGRETGRGGQEVPWRGRKTGSRARVRWRCLPAAGARTA